MTIEEMLEKETRRLCKKQDFGSACLVRGIKQAIKAVFDDQRYEQKQLSKMEIATVRRFGKLFSR